MTLTVLRYINVKYPLPKFPMRHTSFSLPITKFACPVPLVIWCRCLHINDIFPNWNKRERERERERERAGMEYLCSFSRL